MLVTKELYERILEKKGKLDSLRPFQKEALKRLREYLLVELTYNSNAIEGNTLTKQETRLVIEEGLTIGGKSLREHLEAINHPAALDAIEKEAKAGGLSEAFILYLHGIVLRG
jgi:Fic family protein